MPAFRQQSTDRAVGKTERLLFSNYERLFIFKGTGPDGGISLL
jgi:hypothetical protein